MEVLNYLLLLRQRELRRRVHIPPIQAFHRPLRKNSLSETEERAFFFGYCKKNEELNESIGLR